jgi:GT2 family glycosyltransferase
MIPNGAQDGVQDLIKRDILPRSGNDLPQILLIDDGINHGFAGGNNIGIKWVIDNGFDYIFLNNGDLKLDQHTIEEMVRVMESNKSIGSSQAFVRMWNDTQIVNATGGVMHVAGFGYARDNGEELPSVHRQNYDEVMYSSGAAVMYRASALKKVGLLEEGFFMYHEDLELGLRLRFAGYKNVLAANAYTFHNYNFSRNPKKFQWMETYRIVVLLSYLKIQSLILLLPILKMIECGVWLMAINGKWLKAKLLSCIELCKPKTWKLISRMRTRAQKLRIIDDREWMKLLSPVIEYQEKETSAVRIGNRIVKFFWKIIFKFIKW